MPAITTVARRVTLATKIRCAPAEMTVKVPDGITRVRRLLKAGDVKATGAAYARYLKHDEKSGVFELEVGVPVASAARGYGDIYPSELPGGRIVELWHEGPYATLGQSFGALFEWLEAEGLVPNGAAWEAYEVGPDAEANSAKWRTAIRQPI